TSFSYVLLRLNRRLQTESTAPRRWQDCHGASRRPRCRPARPGGEQRHGRGPREEPPGRTAGQAVAIRSAPGVGAADAGRVDLPADV
ncbi:MAG: hypothetical protein MZV49_25220, partial [Rhodopseudomonas palustris]|nr:hypothetical protein [Rhodopseudomonas palustris]